MKPWAIWFKTRWFWAAIKSRWRGPTLYSEYYGHTKVWRLGPIEIKYVPRRSL